MNTRAFAIAALFLTSGCSYTRPLMVAPMALGQKERPLAVVEGRSQADYVLGFCSSGDATLRSAVENAKISAGVKGDTLANVFVDREVYCFPACWLPLYRSVSTHVVGTLVTYDIPGAPPKAVPAPADRSTSSGGAF